MGILNTCSKYSDTKYIQLTQPTIIDQQVLKTEFMHYSSFNLKAEMFIYTAAMCTMCMCACIWASRGCYMYLLLQEAACIQQQFPVKANSIIQQYSGFQINFENFQFVYRIAPCGSYCRHQYISSSTLHSLHSCINLY